MLELRNPIQRYAWGRRDGVAALVGGEPTGGPEAELWVGAHPAAPSSVVGDPHHRTLDRLIADDPEHWLGAELVAAGTTTLPFLLKVLAVGAPLSLQAHPSARQARAGFEREEAAGIDRAAPERRYRDPNAKPESLVAIAPTWALCGFRPADDAAALVAGLACEEVGPLVARLGSGAPGALADALAWILRLAGRERAAVAAAAARAAREAAPGPAIGTGVGGDGPDPISPDAAYRWVATLAEHHPGDPTCLAPLLLELVLLAPGDAVHLPAGNLHAYLDGAGIEVMGASDNVVRGGLTPKHVDVGELLEVVRFEPGIPPPPRRVAAGERTTVYDSGEDAYALAVIEPGRAPVTLRPGAPSLLLATGGPVEVASPESALTLDGGAAAFVAPGEGPLTVSGAGRLWWATVGAHVGG
jgi:mannose-6-phosphate isomerase